MTHPTFDIAQTRYHIQLLTGDAKSPVTWQVFYDVKGAAQRPELAKHFVSTLDQALPMLQQAEANHCGVYIGVNETDGLGRKIENVVKYRAVFADYDDCDAPVWPIAPHFITSRDSTHGHAYWLCDEIAGVDDFRALQRRIAIYLGTDTQVTDPCRVLRAAGSLHFKVPTDPKQYVVTGDNVQVVGKDHRYTLAEIEAAFPLDDKQQEELDKWVKGRESLDVGAGFNDTQIARDRFITWLTDKAEPAVQGSGSMTLIKVTSLGRDLGLPLNVAQELAWVHYDPRCIPSWASTGEKADFYATVARAYQYANNEVGCRTASAAFSAPDLPPVPPMIQPKTDIETLRSGDRLEVNHAKALTPMLNAKSSHYELAQCFDGIVYDGAHIVRCRKVFYEYNGKSWRIVDDEIVKSKIQRFYARFKPADSLTAGVLKCLGDMVAVESIENGTWLHTGEIAHGVVCFRNGLVDLSKDTPEVMTHTPNYFTFNELDYDYDPSATCDQWIGFLESIWSHDRDLILQLQEWFGYCLISDVSMEKFATLVGKPRAGKGTITTVLTKMVGEGNISSPALSNLHKDSTLHRMSTSSVSIIPDAHSVNGASRDAVLANLKAITGGDSIDYHVMYKGTQNSVFKCKMIMSTNNVPEFNDPSGALAARMLVFPFLRSFAKKPDIGLKGRLLSECAGVAQWALKGLERLRKAQKFTEAQSGLLELECIRDDMSPLADFISDMIVEDKTAFSSTVEIFNAYNAWCKYNGTNSPFSKRKMSQLMCSSNLNIMQFRHGGHRGLLGIRIQMMPSITSQ